MGDRFRNGELVALIGTIGLIVAVAFLGWFDADVRGVASDGTPGALRFHGVLSLDAGTIGWFAFLSLMLALVAAIVFFLRALTSRDVERPMLQAPYAYIASGWAFLVLLVRLFVFGPGADRDAILHKLPPGAKLISTTVDMSLASGAWVAFASVTLMMLGFWFAMYDERTGSAAAKRRTEALLAPVRARRIEHVPASGAPEPEATVVADDAVGTDPSSPSSPASGGPA